MAQYFVKYDIGEGEIETPEIQCNDWQFVVIDKCKLIGKLDISKEILIALAGICLSNHLNINNTSLKEKRSFLKFVKLMRVHEEKSYRINYWSGQEYNAEVI